MKLTAGDARTGRPASRALPTRLLPAVVPCDPGFADGTYRRLERARYPQAQAPRERERRSRGGRPVPRVGHDAARSMISGTTPALAVLGRVRDPRFRRRQSGCVATAFAFQLASKVRAFLNSAARGRTPLPMSVGVACASAASASARSRRRRRSSRSMADPRLPFAMNCGRTRGDPRNAAPSAHHSTCRTGNVSVGESRCSIVAARRARRARTFAA